MWYNRLKLQEPQKFLTTISKEEYVLLKPVYSIIISRICWMIRVNHTVVSMTLFSISGLLTIGFLLGDLAANSNYSAFKDGIVWAGAFGSYSAIKFIQSLGRTPICLRALNSVLGLWLWCYLIISFVILDKTAMAPAEPTLLMPLVWELAYITSLIYIYRRLRSSLTRRADD